MSYKIELTNQTQIAAEHIYLRYVAANQSQAVSMRLTGISFDDAVAALTEENLETIRVLDEAGNVVETLSGYRYITDLSKEIGQEEIQLNIAVKAVE